MGSVEYWVDCGPHEAEIVLTRFMPRPGWHIDAACTRCGESVRWTGIGLIPDSITDKVHEWRMGPCRRLETKDMETIAALIALMKDSK